MSKLINTIELAEYLGVSESGLKQSRVKGDGIPFIKIGQLVRYRLEDVEAYLESRMKKNTLNISKGVVNE